jgi:hypothetical protein
MFVYVLFLEIYAMIGDEYICCFPQFFASMFWKKKRHLKQTLEEQADLF